MPDEQKEWIMFETMQAVHVQIKQRKRWNKLSSFAGGIVGGTAAALGIKVGT